MKLIDVLNVLQDNQEVDIKIGDKSVYFYKGYKDDEIEKYLKFGVKLMISNYYMDEIYIELKEE